jgi:hypothetical protein
MLSAGVVVGCGSDGAFLRTRQREVDEIDVHGE